jgi:SAM-dependent methyltransferase
VVGLDAEPDSIARARQVYPAVEFHACDVVDAASVIGPKFDLIYLFNSFYAFADQPRALAVLARLAHEGGRLVLFDYTDRGGYDPRSLLCDGEPLIPHPVKLTGIGDLLHRAGWQLTTVEDLTGAYERWYDALVQQMESKRARIIDAVGAGGFAFVRGQYAGLLAAVRGGTLGGAIIHAQRFSQGTEARWGGQ